MKYISLIILCLANTVLADDAVATQASSGAGLKGLIPLVLIFIVFYFFLIRPQSKKLREHAELIKNLKKGDVVITAGGVEGKITKVEDGFVLVEIADGVVVKVLRASVQTTVVKK
jgi:preprotein translocase subunit YajC